MEEEGGREGGRRRRRMEGGRRRREEEGGREGGRRRRREGGGGGGETCSIRRLQVKTLRFFKNCGREAKALRGTPPAPHHLSFWSRRSVFTRRTWWSCCSW